MRVSELPNGRFGSHDGRKMAKNTGFRRSSPAGTLDLSTVCVPHLRKPAISTVFSTGVENFWSSGGACRESGRLYHRPLVTTMDRPAWLTPLDTAVTICVSPGC